MWSVCLIYCTLGSRITGNWHSTTPNNILHLLPSNRTLIKTVLNDEEEEDVCHKDTFSLLKKKKKSAKTSLKNSLFR